MNRVRFAFLLFASLAGSSALAAPAPFTKPARHPPSPEALLAELRAEGFPLRQIERGPESGTYVVTMNLKVVGAEETLCLTATRKWTVRTDVGDVRAEVRTLLKAAPQTVVYRTNRQPPPLGRRNILRIAD